MRSWLKHLFRLPMILAIFISPNILSADYTELLGGSKKENAKHMVFSHNNNWVAAESDRRVYGWEFKNTLGYFQSRFIFDTRVDTLDIDEHGVILVGSFNSLYLCKGFHAEKIADFPGQIYSASFVPKNETLIVAYEKKQETFIRLMGKNNNEIIEEKYYPGVPYKITFNGNGNFLTLSNNDTNSSKSNFFIVYNSQNLEESAALELHEFHNDEKSEDKNPAAVYLSAKTSSTIHPEKNFVVVNNTQALFTFDLETREKKFLHRRVDKLSLSTKNDSFWFLFKDGNPRIENVNDHGEVSTYFHNVKRTDSELFSHDGSRLLVAKDRRLYLIKLPKDKSQQFPILPEYRSPESDGDKREYLSCSINDDAMGISIAHYQSKKVAADIYWTIYDGDGEWLDEGNFYTLKEGEQKTINLKEWPESARYCRAYYSILN